MRHCRSWPLVKDKRVLIQLPSGLRNVSSILNAVRRAGLREILCEPKEVTLVRKKGLRAISISREGDGVVTNRLSDLRVIKGLKKEVFFKLEVHSTQDIERAVEAAKAGAESVIIETKEWKIIPLENLVAEFRNFDTKIYAKVSEAREIRTMFSVLEKGVDGVSVTVKEPRDVGEITKELTTLGSTELSVVKVLEVKEVGSGDRVCIDTASILKRGEGMLIGSKSNFLFLIHNEAIGSSFTAPRPFRVNAGAVHSYLLMPDGKTRYLSEIEAGDEVFVASKDGSTRSSSVGRVKIENRPLALVKAEGNGESATVIVQNAETIRFVTGKGQPVSVTELKRGDTILAKVGSAKGRHFGIEVDEFILEK